MLVGSITATNSRSILTQFLLSHACIPAPSRPNTAPQFQLVNSNYLPLEYSPSPFNIEGWAALLRPYPGPLPFFLLRILRFGTRIGYTGPEAHILSANLQSALLDTDTIQKKLSEDLSSRRVIRTSAEPPFISSPLGLVPKHDGGYRRIHHLSHPRGASVNDFIDKKSAYLRYTTFQDVLAQVRHAGRHAVIMKKDIKDAFRNIPVAPHQQWLLGFNWNGQFYKETCLPFGLSTAPFLFNLFAEAFHWMIETYLQWERLLHYLDDFISVLQALAATPEQLAVNHKDYNALTDCLGIPRNEAKDCTGTVCTVLGIEIDTNTFEARLPKAKLDQAITATMEALTQRSLSLHDAQSLTGFLSFCSQAVRLGRVFMRRLWDFVASYPLHCMPCLRRKIPPGVVEDLHWWNSLLPTHNGVLYFEEDRESIQLYTDASLKGLGGFYFQGSLAGWSEAAPFINQKHAFAAAISDTERVHINVHEVQAILLAFQSWGAAWAKKKVIIHTDSTTAHAGIQKHTLKGEANAPLRAILLLCATEDILIEPVWIESERNGLADALSRLNSVDIANYCPHWQNPLDSMLLRLPS